MQRTLSTLVSACAALLLVLAVFQAKSEEPNEPNLLAKALTAESEGSAPEAERLLTQAVNSDRGSMPRWTFANYYLRHQDERAWPLLADALSIALHGNQNVSGIFETGWQFRPDASFLLQNLVGRKPDALRAYVSFLLDTGRFAALAEPAAMITDKVLLLRVSNALLTAGKVRDAKVIWDRAVPPPPNGELLVNAELQPPQPLGFDWRFNTLPESSLGFGNGLRIDFTGRQPTPLELLIQTVPIARGRYLLSWESKARPEPGMSWQATGASTFRAPLHSAYEWQAESSEFEVQTPGALRLVLLAERLPGTSRFEGTFQLRHPSLRLR